MIGIGDKLSNRYVLNRLIGQGGMANVFLAHDLILDRDVAVKVLRYDFQENEDAIRRFQREAISASQIIHPNIVEVYDVDEHEKQQYIVMEYVTGHDLKSYIKENAPVPLELVVSIMSQLVAGIDVAHRNRIIHRDIKPQNVLITEDNVVKITDFGIAVALSDTSITQTNTLLGSVHYLSPEQARGASATTKSDIYAMGVVLYELITGKVPHDGESAVSIALKHFQEPFPQIRHELDYVPQSLENVVLKATAKLPLDRYNTANEMLQDLSTSLSMNRMHEKLFVPTSQELESHRYKSIQPIRTSEQVLVEQIEGPEQLDETVFPDIEAFPMIEEHPRRMKWLRTFFYALIFVLLSGALYFAYNRLVLGTVSIPDVSKMKVDDAVSMIEANDLSIKDRKVVWDETVPRGQIIATEPRAGERINRNEAVELLISDGKPRVKIGDYLHKQYEPVRRELIDAGFIVDLRYLASNPEDAGLILEQNLAPGKEVVPSDTTITLVIGSHSESATMQDFYNLSVDLVHKFADNYGLYVEENYEYHDFIPEGQIIEQSPLSGSPLKAGDSIQVVISEGPEKTEFMKSVQNIYVDYVPRYAENDYEKKKPLPNLIEIYIGDANHNINDLAKKEEINESKEFQLIFTIPIDGVGKYRITRDGEVIAESDSIAPGTE